jgi:2-dehydropantoate 2-reductase
MNSSIFPTSVKKTNIVIIGQGAIGLLYYHHFTQQQYSVSLKASTETCQNNPQYSFSAYDNNDDTSLFPLKYAQPVDIQQADMIIFCLKSYQVANAVKELARLVAPHCLLFFAHNGMGVYEEIVEYFTPNQKLLAMLTTHGCLRSSALTIKHTGLGKTDLGVLKGKVSEDEIKTLIKLFNNAIPLVEYHQNIKEKQWLKLAINCAINPISALYNIENGQVMQERFAVIITNILKEVVNIAKSQQIKLSLDSLEDIVKKVANDTAKNSSSMRCDLVAKRPTEIEYINGYIHRLGEQYGIATPENSRLWQEISTLVNAY